MPQKKAYQAIIESKCPKCRKGDMFAYSIGIISKFTRMNEYCNVCGLRFEVEPGFFIGAMYISYAVTVSILFITGIFMWLFDITDLLFFITSVFVIIVTLLPFIFRYSRVLFLHLFGGIKYDSKSTNE
ncbi:MAG: DUF983 domain-containing protein [Cyclobacteriaceae bacterium]|nr:DUF983 domain-containing protein [Cyclobacteriaceae bacterium]